jgi:rubrerythrin
MMKHTAGKESLKDLSIDEIIQTALKLEEEVRTFYALAREDVGADAVVVFSELLEQQHDRIQTLRSLLAEIEELRELSVPMVG